MCLLKSEDPKGVQESVNRPNLIWILTVAGGRRWRHLDDHLYCSTGARCRSWIRCRWARHNTARSAVTGSILAENCRRLAKVSGSQGCQMMRGEDVGPRSRPGFKGDVTGITMACQRLLWHGLTSRWRNRRFCDRQLNGLGKDGTIGFESAVLQVGSRTCVHLPTWQRRLRTNGRSGGQTEGIRSAVNLDYTNQYSA